MEISGKVLREVEFRDRLRGYDTDEVDEFLEKMATAVDELVAEVASLRERAAEADRRAEERPVDDDDAIRRTLILAQRTADLAVKEAKEQAATMMEEAHREADRLVGEATETARRLRAEADTEIHERFDRLVGQREELERQIAALNDLVSSERARLSENLGELARSVQASLVVSDDFARRAATRTPPGEVRSRLSEVLGDDDDLGLSAVEAGLHELPSGAAPSEAPPAFPEHRDDAEAGEEQDVEDELWARWANTGEHDDNGNDAGRLHPGGDRSA